MESEMDNNQHLYLSLDKQCGNCEMYKREIEKLRKENSILSKTICITNNASDIKIDGDIVIIGKLL